METEVKAEVVEKAPLRYKGKKKKCCLNAIRNAALKRTIETIKHVEMYSRGIVDDIKRINGGMKLMFGDVPIPVKGVSKFLRGIYKMSDKHENPLIDMENFNYSAKGLSNWVYNPNIKGFDQNLDTLIKILDKWSMFIDDSDKKIPFVPVENFLIEDAFVWSKMRYSSLELTMWPSKQCSM